MLRVPGRLDVLVSVNAQHFFGKIRFTLDILAEIRHNRGQRVTVKRRFKTQRIQNACHLFPWNFHADAGVYACDRSNDGLFRLGSGIAIVDILK